MHYKINKSLKYVRAFTLIELMVVISIIGMLSSVVLVATQSARDKGRIASIVTFDTYNYHKLGANLIAEYLFDDPANPGKDTSGNGYNLILNNAASDSLIISPNATHSLKISASAYVPYASFNNALGVSIMSPSSKGFTISLWGRKDSVCQDYCYLFTLNNGVTDGMTVYCSGNGNLNAYFNASNFTPSSISTSVCSNINNWHNFTFTYDKNDYTNLTAYIDGKKIGAFTSSSLSPYSYSIKKLIIGNAASPSTKSFGGNLDTVRIYSESLTASAVESIYAEGLKTHEVASAE